MITYFNNQTTKNLSLYFRLMVIAYENKILYRQLPVQKEVIVLLISNKCLFLFLLGSVFRTLWICIVSFGGSVVLLVPAVLIRIKLRKQKRPENYDSIPLQEIHQHPHDLEGIDSVLQEEERAYSNITSHRIPIDTFIKLVEQKKVCNQFPDEFQVT